MKKKYILLLEITIWICVLTGLVFFGFNIIKENLSQRPTYSILFKDIDGLVEGSPVRLMGISIGHVVSVKPLYDEVSLTLPLQKKVYNSLKKQKP